MTFSISPPYKETLGEHQPEQRPTPEDPSPSPSLPRFVHPRHGSISSRTSEVSTTPVSDRKPSPAMLELTGVSTMLRIVLSNQENIMSRLSQLESGVSRIETILYDDRGRTAVRIPSSASLLPTVRPSAPASVCHVPCKFEDSIDSASTTSMFSCTSDENLIRIRENAQLFSAIILGLTAWVRDRLETMTGRIFDAGLKGRFNDFTKVISNVAKDGTLKKVDGSSLKTLRDYQSRSDIFRSLCDFIALLKMMPECLPPPGSDIVSAIGEGLIDDGGNLLIDLSKLVIRPRSKDELVFDSLSSNAIPIYVKFRMEGRGCNESKALAIDEYAAKCGKTARRNRLANSSRTDFAAKAADDISDQFVDFGL
ncbi:unnamed protein product [Peronospora belbahrii]|uniref:Uncharacterized protein n=1 Tax=Peronospora belbahrii TaxID=622444 RepID=A0AAU9KWD7_9STRA|nr:unnamed protein product [Peronospora belbahrii]